jgi:hypothetical protein
MVVELLIPRKFSFSMPAFYKQAKGKQTVLHK